MITSGAAVRLWFTVVIALAGSPVTLQAEAPAAGGVRISANFPGGNVEVQQNDGGTVHVAPDLRGDRPWFYWYFEATAEKAGRVRFVFPEKVAGFKDGGIGPQGPAISTDGGKSWRWSGTENVNGSEFFHDFTAAGESARFAVTIPYVQSNLDAFVEANRDNPHLKVSRLTTSRKGRPVTLLQIGKPGPGVKPVIVTGRHHATETIASYVLEGFLREAMSDSTLAREFRQQYVLFAVPLVDTDGVQDGDQGKNRKPHDHNRDYGEKSIYPEVQAIKDLHDKQQFRFAVDFHCPTLVMPDHQVMYFVGARRHPAYNLENVTEFARWIKQGLPKSAPHGPLVWLRDESKPSPKNSRYFGFQPGMIMAATLEIPFAPKNREMDVASVRKYGGIMLQAWVNTHFVTAEKK